MNKGQKGVETADSLHFTEAEERTLGEDISAKLRDKYGVVQDRDGAQVRHAGRQRCSPLRARGPELQWTFIVLDTDGINAFAAPGGFMHVTRGALALIQNEAELADVLGHEIIHVTAKHTFNAIKKSKRTAARRTSVTAGQKLAAATMSVTRCPRERLRSQGRKRLPTRQGIALANKVGYAPTRPGRVPDEAGGTEQET